MKLNSQHRIAVGIAMLTFALAAFPVAAQTVGSGVQYVTGGIGKGEADALRAQAKGFPLELQFSRRTETGNAFESDVAVRIIDASGRAVLEIPAAQPIVLANVAPGRYTVEATANGQTKRQTVDVGKGRSNISIIW
ncbi:MAG TPA: hypothetical protein VNG69_06495 [Casimicrobiaceae bacterium]|nr:hypothetical protein [Casimicrobiaceae bacterium]